MKFTKYFQSMHYVTIVVLFVVAAIQSIGHGFPVNVIVAVLTASVIDVAIKSLWLKRRPALPLSAIITGLIIGTVSVNAPIMGAFAAAVLAILSKFVIRHKGWHIFNPAVFGVVVSQLLSPAAHGPTTHGVSQAIEGVGIGGLTVSIGLVPLLLFANWRAKKLWISIPYLVATTLLFSFSGLASPTSLSSQGIFSFLEVLPYYFAFIIVSEPRTTPNVRIEQVAFGIGVSVLSILPFLFFGSYSHIGTLVALLLGNIIYALYRTNKTRKLINST